MDILALIKTTLIWCDNLPGEGYSYYAGVRSAARSLTVDEIERLDLLVECGVVEEIHVSQGIIMFRIKDQEVTTDGQ